MKKILFIITTLQRTGPVNILFDLVHHIDRSAYSVHVLTLCPEQDDSRWREFEAVGATVSSMNLPRGARFFAASPRLRREVDKIAPDVVHCFGFRGDLLGAIFLGRYPKVSSQLNYPFDDYVMTYGKAVGGAMAHLTAWSLRRYDHTVACATDVAAKMAKHGVPAKVIYNAIDDARFVPPTPAERAAQRKRLDLWEDADFVLIFVGVLSDRKQPLVALEAFLRFQQMHPKAAMIVLGDGPLAEDCRRLAQGQRVLFAGKVPDTRPYLIAGDAYIATSKAEGMPVSVIEALALRLPVVLSAIDPHREILSIDPGAGHLVSVGSVADTAEALHRLKEGDLAAMGDHARRIIDQELSARVMSAKFQVLYRELSP